MKKIGSIFLILAFLCSIKSYSQTFPYYEWSINTGGSVHDVSLAFTKDNNGNIYSVGYFGDTVDFDPGPGVFNLISEGYSDLFIQKLDGNGGFVWAKAIHGPAVVQGKTVSIDENDNIMVGVVFKDSADFDPGPGTDYLYSNGGFDYGLVKLDNNGNYLWSTSFGSTDNDILVASSTDLLNNTVLTGEFNNTVDFDPGPSTFDLVGTGTKDYFVQKIDANGNFVWAFKTGTGIYATDASAIVTDSVNNIYVYGECPGAPTDFDPGTGIFYLATDAKVFIQKINPDGNFIWAKSFNGPNFSYMAYDINVDNVNNIFVTGKYSVPLDVDPGPGVFQITPTTSGTDTYIVKLDSSGNFLWASTNTGNSVSSINHSKTVAFDSNNNVYETGYYLENLNLDDGGADSLISSSGAMDSYVVKRSSNGVFEWGISLGGFDWDFSYDILLDDQDDLYVLLNHWYYGDFDPGPDSVIITSNGGMDFIVLKLNQCNGNVISLDSTSLVDITGNCAVHSLPTPTASSTCDGTIPGVSDAIFPITTVGTNIITWTYSDGFGNSISQSQNVIISGALDVTPPTPDSVSLPAINQFCFLDTLPPPSSFDDCDGTILGTPDISFPFTSLGTTTITWTFIDQSGNSSSLAQQITIYDNAPPILGPSLATVVDECEVSLPTPTATDVCAGVIPGIPDVTFPITTPGLTVVTWTFNDGNGNSITQTQNVNIIGFSNVIGQVGDSLYYVFSGFLYQWVDCDNSFAPIPGATNQGFEPGYPGNFAVQVSNGVCSEISDCAEILPATSEIKNNHYSVEIYPNPTHDFLYIKSNSDNSSKFVIRNSLGQEVSNGTINSSTTLDLTDFSKGLYTLEIQLDNKHFIRQIIKM